MTGPAEHPLDELAVYALDALGPDEQRTVDAHLAGCADCRAALDLHRAVLADTVDDAEGPPVAVWDRIRTQLSPRQPLVVDSPAAPPAPIPVAAPVPVTAPPMARTSSLDDRRARSRRPVRWLAAAAVALVAIVGAGVLGRSLSDDGSKSIADLATAAAADPGSVQGVLHTAGGHALARAVVGHDGTFVILDAAEPLPDGQSYQLWSLDGDKPVSLGLLGDGRDSAIAVPMPAGVKELAISKEPSAGATTPTGILAEGTMPA